MSELNAYKQKLEAEIEQAETKLKDLKAEAKSSAADAQIRMQYDQRTQELEQHIDNAKAKLKELGGASEDAWEELKEGIENAWDSLRNAVREGAAKVKEKFKD
ncbi:hypothetical protein [Nitrosomonas communis]|uniref:Coiled coil domain-containing protein n=1 Tax=Nitrosomonas communis TaxID=44574 RepID=A0A1H2UPY8_9PROT|nr:hypothetical protein [Nitrosomonas communis]SDW57629.1 hypothetical protein SAMN05421882_10175 [Nitrosomonas communis]